MVGTQLLEWEPETQLPFYQLKEALLYAPALSLHVDKILICMNLTEKK